MGIINIKDKSGKLYYVGGVVRDFLLGCKSLDIDLTYEGNAIEYAKNLDVIQVNEPFGTVKVIIDGRQIDIASTRKEIYERKGHLPTVTEIGGSLKEDILRRDFTVNCLAMRVNDDEVIDYVGGLKDLKEKKLRVLHDNSFIDDPTRIIRGLKFTVRLGFELEKHTRVLQEKYLKNINYDMCYKRVKKELIETFQPHLLLDKREAFERFIKEGIYKLVTPNEVKLPTKNMEDLIYKYGANYVWLVYVGVLDDLSRLPLTKNEQRIIDDLAVLKRSNLTTDFKIYKGFDGKAIETILLYAILENEKTARQYLDNLKGIKLFITGDDLQKLGIKPSQKYSECFDFVLEKKLAKPNMTKEEELEEATCFFEC